MRNSSSDSKVTEEGGGGGRVGTCGPDSKAGIPLQPMKNHWEADIPTVARGSPRTAADELAPKEAVVCRISCWTRAKVWRARKAERT